MRILMILKYIPSETSDRKGDAITATIRAHEAAGHEVVLLTIGRREQNNWKVVDTSLSLPQRFKRKILSFVSQEREKKYLASVAAEAAVKYNEKEQINAVFAYCTSGTPALIASAIKDRAGIPFVIRDHRFYEYPGSMHEVLTPAFRNASRNADGIFAVSPQQAESMKSFGIRDSIGCLPNAIPDYFFNAPEDPGPFREWAGENFVFAGWTRWREVKRLDLLIRAFAEVHQKHPDTRLIIAGGIEPRRQQDLIYSLLDIHGILDSVLLFGAVGRKEVHQLAHASDCYVMPSDYEALPLPALESMAAGNPVVATRCHGPESIITSDELGRLVGKSDVKALAEAMADVYSGREGFRKSFIQNTARDRYSVASVGGRIREMYNDLLE